MPEADASEQKIAPKSVLRHRPIGEKDRTGSVQERFFVPIVQRTSRLSNRTESESVSTWKHPTPASIGQQRPASSLSPSLSASRPSRHAHPSTFPPIGYKTRTTQTVRSLLFQAHPLLLLGLGLLLMLSIWMLLSTVLGWANMTLNILRYGNPPTYQVDAFVGHNEQAGVPTHFIVLNLHRRIEIIEIEGSDPTHTRIYPGPQLYGSQDDMMPATLSFVTPPGKKYPTMILHIGTTQLTYLNTGQAFVPT